MSDEVRKNCFGLQFCLDCVDEHLIFLIGEIYFARIHLECASIVGTIDVFGSKMKMEVAQFVAIGAIIYLFWMESFLHGACHLGHVGHESVALLVRQFIEVVDMSVVGH